MRSNKKDLIEMILLAAILVILIVILVMTGYKMKVDNDNDNTNNNYIEENIDTNNKKDDNSQNNSDNATNDKNSNKDNNIDNNIGDNSTNSSTNNNSTTTDNIDNQNGVNDDNNNNNDIQDKVDSIDGENAVVSYFSELEKNIELYNNQEDKTFREKAKEIFITTVDFLFYNGEIKGYTFDELSLTTKMNVLKIAASIDNKIDTYFPNYKDTIKEKSSDLKGKIAVLYLETTNKFCSKVGETACDEARNDFNNMKTSFGYTWSILKEALTTSKDKLTVILDEWYKSIK